MSQTGPEFIRIEGDRESWQSRVAFDLSRHPGVPLTTVCHAPFVSLDLRASGATAPCRYCQMDVGRIQDNSLESIWNGQELDGVRKRFRDYHVRAGECGVCVEHWLDGAPE